MHKSLSYKALRDYFKTEKQILKEKFKEETKEKIKELIKTNQINEIDPIHGTALNRAIKINHFHLRDESLSIATRSRESS